MNRKNKQGFTIIEVVLVLAIAGLIFLMVFIALPALQRSQRNTQRRDDYSMLVTAVNSYLSSNNGKITNLTNQGKSKALDAKRWINSTGADPSGNPYQVMAISFENWSDSKSQPKGIITESIEVCEEAEDGKDPKCETKDRDSAGSQVYIITQANCSETDEQGDPMPDKDPAARSFVVYGYLEGGGFFCQASGAQKND